MNKIVDVNATYPVSGVPGFVRGRLVKVTMSTENIYKCLCCRAEVIEYVGNNRIKLTISNYNKDNTPKAKPITKPIDAPKVIEHNEPMPEIKKYEPVVKPTYVAAETTIDINDKVIPEDEAITTDDAPEELESNEEHEDISEITDEVDSTPTNVNVPKNRKHKR